MDRLEWKASWEEFDPMLRPLTEDGVVPKSKKPREDAIARHWREHDDNGQEHSENNQGNGKQNPR